MDQISTLISIQSGKIIKEPKYESAFDKNQYHQKIQIKNTGLVGDEIADKKHHGGIDKAVFANSFKNYKQWSEFLGLKELNFGALGENLTFDNICEDDVCIGDIHKIGTTILQVSQPRKPCWKISHRWDNKDFTKHIYKTGRTGWYYRVLQEGFINKNDKVKLVQKGESQISIALANQVYQDPDSNKDIAKILLDSKILATAWRNGLIKRLTKEEKLSYMIPPK